MTEISIVMTYHKTLSTHRQCHLDRSIKLARYQLKPASALRLSKCKPFNCKNTRVCVIVILQGSKTAGCITAYIMLWSHRGTSNRFHVSRPRPITGRCQLPAILRRIGTAESGDRLGLNCSRNSAHTRPAYCPFCCSVRKLLQEDLRKVEAYAIRIENILVR